MGAYSRNTYIYRNYLTNTRRNRQTKYDRYYDDSPSIITVKNTLTSTVLYRNYPRLIDLIVEETKSKARDKPVQNPQVAGQSTFILAILSLFSQAWAFFRYAQFTAGLS